ncbi:MAG: hypothetical protein ABH859_08145 [Pseudomonadota bacterium]
MEDTNQKYRVRPPNWLPLPHQVSIQVAQQNVDENDLFSKGEVISFYPWQGYGYIKTNNNQELIFKLNEIDLKGEKTDPSYLAVGLKVGYDVAQASDGLHVKSLKIY